MSSASFFGVPGEASFPMLEYSESVDEKLALNI